MRRPDWPRKSRKGQERRGKETISGVTEDGNQAVFLPAQGQRVPRAGNLMACFIPASAKTNVALIKALPSVFPLALSLPHCHGVGSTNVQLWSSPPEFRKDLGPALVSHLSSLLTH